MGTLPEYAEKNREAWTKMNTDFHDPGRKAWAQESITWGCWNLPESEINALGDVEGLDVVELGCGTGYLSSWLARRGARAVGIDVTPAQLESARTFQREFGVNFPLIEASAEEAPLPNASFDLAVSEYGASIWCDPHKWIPEAARLLRPNGRLVFLRNGTLGILSTGPTGPATDRLVRPLFGLKRLDWEDDGSVEFHLPIGKMIDLLHNTGFQLERLIEVEPPAQAEETRFEYMTLEWAKQWPSEEIWCAKKVG